MLKRLFFILALSLFSLVSQASVKGYIVLDSKERIYVNYSAPKSKDHPIFVLVNGLVYETERWERMVAPMIKEGAGVLRYDFKGQHRTFIYAMEDSEGNPDYFYRGIKLSQNAKDLKELLDKLQIDRPVQLVGLSYGSTIAAEFAKQFPSRIDNLIFMSPLVISLDKYDSQGAMIRTYLDSMNWWGPVGRYWSDYYYDIIYRHYFDETLSDRNYRYGEYEDAFRKSLFYQVRAAKDFDLRHYDFSRVFKDQKVHLMLADKEEKKYLKDMLEVWKKTKNNVRGSLSYYENTHHAIPDTNPYVSSLSLLNIAGKNPAFFGGEAFHLRRNNNGIFKEPIEDISILLE